MVMLNKLVVVVLDNASKEFDEWKSGANEILERGYSESSQQARPEPFDLSSGKTPVFRARYQRGESASSETGADYQSLLLYISDQCALGSWRS